MNKNDLDSYLQYVHDNVQFYDRFGTEANNSYIPMLDTMYWLWMREEEPKNDKTE